jgi:dihydrofolate synthase / folylpolyglutamate synthase
VPRESALAYLASFTDFEQRLATVPRSAFALDRFERLLERLGRPELGRMVIHVAGTKGKGATVLFADAVLRAHGVRTMRYVSPHVERVGERIALDGAELSDAGFAALTDEARPAFDAAVRAGEPPTFFEALTALAFLAARDAGAEADVLETGLGGRLDATNVCRPTATVITSIDLDHVRLLGATRELIAAEKAGIVKAKVPLYCGLAPEDAGFDVIREKARAADAPLVRPGAGLAVARAVAARLSSGRLGVRFDGHVDGVRLVDAEAPGGGPHQAVNALLATGAAFRVLAALGRRGDPTVAARALATTELPARAEEFAGRPAVVLDGAHTPRSVEALIALVAATRPPDAPLVLLAGATEEREPTALFSGARSRARAAVFVRIPSPRSADPCALLAAWIRSGGVGDACEDAAAGLERARELAGPTGAVVVVGSFYLAGAVRTLLRCRPG